MKRIFILAIAFCFISCAANAQNFDSLNKAPAEPAKTQAAATDNCVDDPRLVSEIVNIMDSTTPINPPITITPETYLTLESEVANRLAGQMIICPNIPVLKNGKPAKKVLIDFEPIWQAIQNAAAKEDMESVARYVNGFMAKPKSIQEITMLLVPFQLEEKKKEALYKTAGVEMYQGNKPRFDLDVLDFYIRLGGKSSEDAVLLITSQLLDSLEQYKDEFKKNVYNIKGDSMATWTARANKLKAMGIHVEHK